MNMTTNELQRLESLVLNAARDKETALQLAIDATKLLAVTKENLDDYKEHGFFTHCSRMFCGEQDSIDEVDENSLTTVQRMAFAYLMKLKEQNRIDEKAVATGVQNEQDETFATAAVNRQCVLTLTFKVLNPLSRNIVIGNITLVKKYYSRLFLSQLIKLRITA